MENLVILQPPLLKNIHKQQFDIHTFFMQKLGFLKKNVMPQKLLL